MNKITKIVVGIIALGAVGFGGYYYFSGNNLEKDNSLNYTFNTKASLKIKENGREEGFDLDIKNASIITKDKGLKQRIKLDNLDLNIIGEEKNNLSNIDIVSDNENVYLKGDFGKISNNFSSKLKEILETGKYAKIDNSKPILDILGELQNNELIKELVIGSSTSNPEEYYKKHKTIEKLLTELKTDKLLNFVFKDGEYNEVTKKTALVFNEKLCNLTPVITKTIGQVNPMFREDLPKEDCIEALKQANQFLSFVNIYKEGDSKAGNYKFVINQGTAVDISINYKNHIINTWALSFAEPTGKVLFRANGDTNKILSSLVKINISENGIKVNGEIKDGKGKIIVKSDENNSEFNLNGFLDVENYRLNSYELNGNSKSFKLISKANKNNLFFNLDAQDYSGKKIAKVDFKVDYSNLVKANYNLDLDIEKQLKIKSIGNLFQKKLDLDYSLFRYNGNKNFDIVLKSDLKSEKIMLNAIEYGYGGEERDKFIFDYNKGKIKGNYGRKTRQEYVYTGNFKNLGEFNFNINNIEGKEKININGKNENNIYKYSLNLNKKGKEFAKGNAEVKIEDNKINSNGNFKFEKEKFEANYNFEFDYKKGIAKYEIPKEFEEIDIKLLEINILPNFEEIGDIKGTYGKMLVVGSLATVGTASYISLQGYTSEAYDTKRVSDLMQLSTVLQMYYLEKGEYPKKDTFTSELKKYFGGIIPKDPKKGQIGDGCIFGYKYEVGDDENGIEYQAYKLSVCTENRGLIERGNLKEKNIKESFYIDDLN